MATNDDVGPRDLSSNGRPAKNKQYPVNFNDGKRKCSTDSIGLVTPKGRSDKELRLHAAQGFIPLWDVNVTLYYRFQDHTLEMYTADPEGTKQTIRELLNEALDKWGDAAPVRFMENDEIYDFEIAMHADEGGVLASAFFPDGGLHELVIYPAMLRQKSNKERVDTLIHELGHIFGLRHFFAAIREKGFPSVLWGKHSKFSIMNYEDHSTNAEESHLTKDDKDDLAKLYELAWSKRLIQINRTPIVLFRPYHNNMP
ncbi:hypothetical protein BGZ73_007393 [Actinomortierella ambigua]|nr:hypothetical protein BGZ73_007393 [Actinomortierella ambigua]